MLVGVERVHGGGAVRGRSRTGAAVVHRRPARGVRTSRTYKQVSEYQIKRYYRLLSMLVVRGYVALLSYDLYL